MTTQHCWIQINRYRPEWSPARDEARQVDSLVQVVHEIHAQTKQGPKEEVAHRDGWTCLLAARHRGRRRHCVIEMEITMRQGRKGIRVETGIDRNTPHLETSTSRLRKLRSADERAPEAGPGDPSSKIDRQIFSSGRSLEVENDPKRCIQYLVTCVTMRTHAYSDRRHDPCPGTRPVAGSKQTGKRNRLEDKRLELEILRRMSTQQQISSQL